MDTNTLSTPNTRRPRKSITNMKNKKLALTISIIMLLTTSAHATQYEWWDILNGTNDMVLNTSFGGEFTNASVQVSSILAGGYDQRYLIDGINGPSTGGWDGMLAANPWWVEINASIITPGKQICPTSLMIADQNGGGTARAWASGYQLYATNTSWAAGNQSILNKTFPNAGQGNVNRTANFTKTCASTWRIVWANASDNNAPAIGEIAFSNITQPFQIGTNYLRIQGNITNNTVTTNESYSLNVSSNSTGTINIYQNGILAYSCTSCKNLTNVNLPIQTCTFVFPCSTLGLCILAGGL